MNSEEQAKNKNERLPSCLTDLIKNLTQKDNNAKVKLFKVKRKKKKLPFDSRYNQGRWTDIEHQKFLDSITLIEKNDWNKFQKLIPTRNGVQIRSHAQKFLIKILKKQGLLKKGEVNRLDKDLLFAKNYDLKQMSLMELLSHYKKHCQINLKKRTKRKIVILKNNQQIKSENPQQVKINISNSHDNKVKNNSTHNHSCISKYSQEHYNNSILKDDKIIHIEEDLNKVNNATYSSINLTGNNILDHEIYDDNSINQNNNDHHQVNQNLIIDNYRINNVFHELRIIYELNNRCLSANIGRIPQPYIIKRQIHEFLQFINKML